MGTLQNDISQMSLIAIGVGALLLLALSAIAWRTAKNKRLKKPLFIGMALTTGAVTLVVAGGTLLLNISSYVGGPVHWHADFQIWACNNQLNLRDPSGLLNNKIGTATLHEHNDGRIHVEGTPISSKDASLGEFMQVVGGELNPSSMVVPLNNGNYFEGLPQAPEQIEPFIHSQAGGKIASFVNGQSCGDQVSEVQVFVYTYDSATKTISQTKLADPADYAINHYEDVPPGDCVIMEFAPREDHTAKLCTQYASRQGGH